MKVRETYDLHTVKNKMTIIGIHTPKPDIIKANFPGLLMQCKGYRPASCDVKIACASVLPLDPQGVGLAEGDVAPEDVFNPILFKATSNFGMSQIEARIWQLAQESNVAAASVIGQSSNVKVDGVANVDDEFPIYYGLLSNAHGWRHANPQSGLSMTGLRPLVYEMLYNVGDNDPTTPSGTDNKVPYPAGDNTLTKGTNVSMIRGDAKPIPFMNCTSYSSGAANNPFQPSGGDTQPFNVYSHEIDVPWINCVVGAIIIPPSRLHELFYRMVVEWTLEFTAIRPIGEITDFTGLSRLATLTHYQNYSYEATKKAVVGDIEPTMTEDTCMVSANVGINKVM